MIRILFIALLVLGNATVVICQLNSPEKSARKNIIRKRWEKAAVNLERALAKDSVNAYANYLYSVYFFQQDNPAFNIDSSYKYVTAGIEDFAYASFKQRDRWLRLQFDSSRLVRMRQNVDSAEFRRVRAINTEEAYNRFIAEHPHASLQRPMAIQLRDEAAYQTAVREHTYQAFRNFLNKYPGSMQASQAQEKYDRLLYESLTKDRKLSTYEDFLSQHATSPFRREVEDNIFQLSTMSGDAKDFERYINRHPGSVHVKRAREILFHLLLEQDADSWPERFLNDSLLYAISVRDFYIVPFLKGGKFGLMEKSGREVMPAIMADLREEYKCGNIQDDFLIDAEGLVSRTGTRIFIGKVDTAEDIGVGFLKVVSDDCVKVVHKAGFVAHPCAQDAKVVAGRFLAVLNDSTWWLYAFTGKKLTANGWSGISTLGNVLQLSSESTNVLVTANQVVKAVEDGAQFGYNAVHATLTDSNMILVRTSGGEALLDQQLHEVIPVAEQKLTPSFFGVISKLPHGYALHNWEGNAASIVDDVQVRAPWLVVKKDGLWYETDIRSYKLSPHPYDSIHFHGPFLVGITTDTFTVHFSKTKHVRIARPATVTFLPGKDSTSFLIVDRENRKMLYDSHGRPLFPVTYDNIQHAGRNLFIVTRKDKKGLVDTHGKTVLPFEYDAIGNANGNTISLLKNSKFGLFNIESKKLIKPQYDKNLMPYGPNTLAAFREGRYIFVGWDNKPDKQVGFDDIRVWNDTTAWVKDGGWWNLYDFKTKQIVEEEVEEIRMLLEQSGEKLAVIKKDDGFGVFHNTRGIIIPTTFSDLVNIGTPEEPLYFTEKHVAEAQVFVVIYYDENGKMLRREVYDQPEDYEKIYCPQD